MNVRGVNLGGWLVLEPWITPSLFYQFLGTDQRWGELAPNKTAMDSYTFCTALGSYEANRQLQIHWKKFVTEQDFRKLHQFGVNSIRIPVGDWIFSTYYPYRRCFRGALKELKRGIHYAEKYNMTVLLDIHSHRGSQNGFDNSGLAHDVQWTFMNNSITFDHWTNRKAEWIGDFDSENQTYSYINTINVVNSLYVISKIAKMFHHHPAVLGIAPMNEPWELTPLELLKDFYWDGYKIVKRIAPHWKYVIDSSFRFNVDVWRGFMVGCPDVALDTHVYEAWMDPSSKETYFQHACQQSESISQMQEEVMPVIVGEWSLATDNCAMWLNGFNDNVPGFPKVQCQMIDCPPSYLGKHFPGQLNRSQPMVGPYGTGGISGPSYGKCPITSNKAIPGISDHEMTSRLGRKLLQAFSVGYGYYFWNFKAELDIKWDFIRAVKAGYLPKDVSKLDEIEHACDNEKHDKYLCRTKRDVPEVLLQDGLTYACGVMNCTGVNEMYPHILDRCDHVYNAYWHKERLKGATCSFSGAAYLVLASDAKLPREVYVPPVNLTDVGQKRNH